MARKTGPDARTVAAARERAGGLCERCGFAECQQVHHRRPRGMGGTRDQAANALSNLFYVCYPCHRWIEENRAEALEDGYLVSRLSPVAPADVPVLYRGTKRYMNDEGETVKCRGSGLTTGSSVPGR
ncbi:HNH endonuclease [Gordonia phage Banquo]|nr:HNH endonuclease [Gordonia phage Banquo]